jgi:3-deoxy-D-manno-octulosonic-acid transferase
MSVAWFTYRVAAPLLGAIAPAAGVFTSPQERPLWRERLGDVRLPGGCHAWVHAASLGEAAAVPPLLRELRRTAPASRVWLTATSRTGRQRLAGMDPHTSLAPIDSPQATRRFVHGIQPHRVFLMETELWPHWLMRAVAEGIPVAVVSARLAERSVGHYRGLGRGFRRLVSGLSAVLCQTEEDADRWLAIGAPNERTAVVGNLKSDGLPEPAADREAERRALGLDPARPLLVLGSLRPGEPRALARAWLALPAGTRTHWQVVAVPRHPRASEELRLEATAAGVGVTNGRAAPGEWRWDDRMGVLTGWYRAGEAAFVGGSLARFGGHNPLEPAACGAAVLMGPHHASQASYVRALRAAEAIVIAAPGDPLAAALRELLEDGAARARRAESGIAVTRAQRGAAERAVRRLTEWGLWPA